MKLLYYSTRQFLRARIPLILLLFFSFEIYSQQDPAVSTLLNQRANIIVSGASTSEIDLQLYSLGHVPTAVLQIHVQPEMVSASWDVYRIVSEQRAAQIYARLSSHYSHLLSIHSSVDGMSVTALFKSGTTPAQIGEVSNHFGFQGYEEH